MDWEHNGDYLIHHGIKGQRWGIRRYQNEDGTLTDAGRKRLGYSTKEQPIVSRKEYRQIMKSSKKDEQDFRNEKKEALRGQKGSNRDRIKKEYAEIESGMAKSRAVLEKNAGHSRAAIRFTKKAEKLSDYAKSETKKQNSVDEEIEVARKDMADGKNEAINDLNRLKNAKDPSEISRIKNECLKKAYDAERAPSSNVFGDKNTGYYSKMIDELQRDMIDNSGLWQEKRSVSKGHKKLVSELESISNAVNQRRKEIDEETGYSNIWNIKSMSKRRNIIDKRNSMTKKDSKLKEIRAQYNETLTKMDKQILKDMGLPINEENLKLIRWLSYDMVD